MAHGIDLISWYSISTPESHTWHGCCQCHKSMSIPWAFSNSMSPCLYHRSMSKQWVHIYTMSPCLYQKSDFIPRVHVYTMSLDHIHFISFPYHEKNSFQTYRNTNNKNKEILISKLQKEHLQIYRSTNYSNTEIQNNKLKKYNL